MLTLDPKNACQVASGCPYAYKTSLKTSLIRHPTMPQSWLVYFLYAWMTLVYILIFFSQEFILSWWAQILQWLFWHFLLPLRLDDNCQQSWYHVSAFFVFLWVRKLFPFYSEKEITDRNLRNLHFLKFLTHRFLPKIYEILIRKVRWTKFNNCPTQRNDYRTFKLKSSELEMI